VAGETKEISVTIRAVSIDFPHDAFVRNRLRFAFEMQTVEGRRMILAARRGEERMTEGWYDRADLERPGQRIDEEPADGELAPVIVELPRDVAAALADEILTESYGTPAGDVRALRADLTHEQSRRDRIEDALIELATSRSHNHDG